MLLGMVCRSDGCTSLLKLLGMVLTPMMPVGRTALIADTKSTASSGHSHNTHTHTPQYKHAQSLKRVQHIMYQP